MAVNVNYVVKTLDETKMYKSTKTDSEVLCTLKKGLTVSCYKKSDTGKWFYITYNKLSGWCLATSFKIIEYKVVATDSISGARDKVTGSKILINGKTEEEIIKSMDNINIIKEEAIPSLENLIMSNGLVLNAASADIYNKFSRIDMKDPYNALTGATREYLFFVKPDFNIISLTNADALIKAIQNNPFFMDLANKNPEVIKMLQYSYDFKPFCPMLSRLVNSNMQLPNIDADVIDGPTNKYGTMIEYRSDGRKSDENVSFSLEFRENKNLDVFMFFKAYEKYTYLKKIGVIEPKFNAYREYKILHDQMGIFKIIVGEDLETILYYAYAWGCKPLNVPRDGLSDIDPTKLISYNIDWKAAFVDDMDPMILAHFNDLAIMQLGGKGKEIPLYDFENSRINLALADCAKVVIELINGKEVYKLKWFKGEN
jgi:hypothetical protein